MTAIVVLFASVLVILTVAIHLVLLRKLSHVVMRMRGFPIIGMGIAMVTAILGHIVEICVFAVAFWWMSADERFGHWVGDAQGGMQDYFYYSALTFTSLGFGDVAPTGSLRVLAAVEAITGLVLIALTASFAFLAMRRLWEKHEGDP